MKIMIMAGTTEGVKIIAMLASLENTHIIATTVTKEGGKLAKSAGAQEVLSEALNKEAIEKIIKTKKIDLIIDATHPFAEDGTRNAIKAANGTGIKYLRFERSSINFTENDLIYFVSSFENVASKVLEIIGCDNPRILHLAGVMTLHYLTQVLNPENIIVRVLPSVYSIKKCLDLGLPSKNIIAMQGIFSKDFNRVLMKEYDIRVIITKESGNEGGTPSKIEAALELGIPVVMVMRPIVSEIDKKTVFNNVNDLLQEIINFTGYEQKLKKKRLIHGNN
jgi:precorrin-6A/cobalt-precorrin-6A reductase